MFKASESEICKVQLLKIITKCYVLFFIVHLKFEDEKVIEIYHNTYILVSI